MKQYHIVYKLNSETDFYSQGKNYETNMENEVQGIIDVLNKWKVEYPSAVYPNRKLMVLYPINN